MPKKSTTIDSQQPAPVGRPLRYTPEELDKMLADYVEWAAENPVFINRAGKDGAIVSVPTDRPLTLYGFCVFADMAVSTFYELEKREEFSNIISRARLLFTNSQITGALVGAYNPSLVARMQGLADRSEVTHRTAEERIAAMSDEELKAEIARFKEVSR